MFQKLLRCGQVGPSGEIRIETASFFLSNSSEMPTARRAALICPGIPFVSFLPTSRTACKYVLSFCLFVLMSSLQPFRLGTKGHRDKRTSSIFSHRLHRPPENDLVRRGWPPAVPLAWLVRYWFEFHGIASVDRFHLIYCLLYFVSSVVIFHTPLEFTEPDLEFRCPLHDQ